MPCQIGNVVRMSGNPKDVGVPVTMRSTITKLINLWNRPSQLGRVPLGAAPPKDHEGAGSGGNSGRDGTGKQKWGGERGVSTAAIGTDRQLRTGKRVRGGRDYRRQWNKGCGAG